MWGRRSSRQKQRFVQPLQLGLELVHDLKLRPPGGVRKGIGARAGSRSAVWAPQGGDGQRQVLKLRTLPDVENVALAPSQGHQRPRRPRNEEGEPP
jgi:hypothetical protein